MIAHHEPFNDSFQVTPLPKIQILDSQKFFVSLVHARISVSSIYYSEIQFISTRNMTIVFIKARFCQQDVFWVKLLYLIVFLNQNFDSLLLSFENSLAYIKNYKSLSLSFLLTSPLNFYSYFFILTQTVFLLSASILFLIFVFNYKLFLSVDLALFSLFVILFLSFLYYFFLYIYFCIHFQFIYLIYHFGLYESFFLLSF